MAVRPDAGPDLGAHAQYDAARDRTRAAAPPLADELVTPLLELRGITKAFPGVQALDDVSLGVQAGEVHMLLGENGAGKSTLMKILCGAYRADAGEILVDGEPVRLRSPADARKLGIAVIFQEFSLVPYLDIAQNIFLGREPPRPHARHRSTAADARRGAAACSARSASTSIPRTLVARARRRAAADGRDRQGARRRTRASW